MANKGKINDKWRFDLTANGMKDTNRNLNNHLITTTLKT